MKAQHLLLLSLALFLVAATYHEGQSFTFNGYEHNITRVVGDRVIVDSEYGLFFLREGDCVQFDTHNWCTENVTKDRVEFYPHEYEIVVRHERLCSVDECKPYGSSCEEQKICTDYCVNEVCRPDPTWCGDGVCDSNEICVTDCPEQAVNETNSTETNTTVSDQTNTTTNTRTEEVNETVEENSTEVLVAENTTQEPVETVTQEQEEEQPSSLVGEPQEAEEEVNVLGAGITIFGGIAMIFVIFNKKRKRKKELELYSYRK